MTLLNVVATEGAKRVKIPKWESELWSYISSSDGKHCPLYGTCTTRIKANLCSCDYVGYVEELLATKQWYPADYSFVSNIEYCKVFELVEKLANKYLKLGGVKQLPVPTELISLADESQPIEVRLIPMTYCNGATWHLNNQWVVYINANDPEETRRFSLFHEAFHIITQCKNCYSLKERHDDSHSFYELLTEHFAASILMPREWVKKKWLEGNNLDSMATIFMVPKPVMYIELKLLRLA